MESKESGGMKDLSNWELDEKQEPLIINGKLNEEAYIHLLNNSVLKLLQWYSHHKGTVTQNAVPKLLCRYTDRLMEVFSNPSSYVQLQAGRLLQSKAMPVVNLVMKLSPETLAERNSYTSNEGTCATCVVLLECFMLNCLSQKSICEVDLEEHQVLLSLLFKHLEYIPDLQNPQHMVKLIVIHSVLNTIYWRLKWVSSIHCVPSDKCIAVIEAISSYPIQTLKLLAKSVLSLFLPYLIHKPQQIVLLDDVEMQTCLNLLQGRTTLYQATVLPMCSYIGDLVKACNGNKRLFLQWHGHALLQRIKDKCESIVVTEEFERLESLLTRGEKHPSMPMRKKTEKHDIQLLVSPTATDEHDLELPDTTFDWFDLFRCMVKHLVAYIENVVLTSANLSLSMVNSITLILGTIRHILIDDSVYHKSFHFLAKDPHFLSALNQLLSKWPELPDCFPLLGNAFYGCLITGSNHKEFCVELGRSGLLRWLLSFLYTAGVVGDIMQFGDIGNVIGILVVLFNCAQHHEVIPALEMVSTVNILIKYAQCPVIRVAVLAKFILSFMEFALENLSVLELTEQDLSYASLQLSEALVSGSSMHWYTDLELLKVLTNLTQSPQFSKNLIQILINQGENSVLSMIAQYSNSSKLEVQKASLKFLLNLYSFIEQPCIKHIHGENASIVQDALNTLATGDGPDIQELVTCIRLLLDPNLTANSDQILHCIELCYKFNLHDKCLKLCTTTNLPVSDKLYLYMGKALFHLYRKEQEYLWRHSKTLNQRDLDKKKSSCYDKTKECIKLLGTVLDQNCTDQEYSKMLDMAMLDYIREVNKLNNLKRCMLCREKRSLMRSHLWPRSFLRRYSYSRVQDISSRMFISFSSTRPREKSPGELTYWMLCGKCEQRISQNGEDKFGSEIYDIIASSPDKDISIAYGPWLYNFSIGLVFRTFLFFSVGSMEYYSIFQQCREHILKLPVKYQTDSNHKSGNDAMNVNTLPETISSIHSDANLSASGGKQVTEIDIPVVILINPTKLNVNHPRKSMLIGALLDAGSALMSGHYLTTGELDLSGKHHFIVVRLGNLSILLPLKALGDVIEYHPPEGCLIKLQGGNLVIPAESKRWDLIPDGLWVAMDVTAKSIEETSLHHYAYKSKTGHWKSLTAEEQELPCTSIESASKERVLHKSLKEASNSPESSFVSRFLNTSYPSLSFLPDEIKLFQKHEDTKKGYLQLPNSHFILCHDNIDLDEDALTIFLVGKFEESSSQLRTYVIFAEHIRGVQMAYGAYIDVNRDGKICITDSLIDMKKFSKHHMGRFEHYCRDIEKVFPLLLKAKGFDNIEVAIQRAKVTRLNRLLMVLGSLDFKCKNGCWYCEGNCLHCQQPANVGYSLRTIGGTALKFCKDNPCYAFYSCDVTSEPGPVIIVPLPIASTDSELLLQITKVISTRWSENTVVVIQLCISNSHDAVHELREGQLYLLTQFRTHHYHAFFDYSISDQYVPLKALWYMQHKHSALMRHHALFTLMLKFIVEDSLSKTSYKTLQGLIASHQSAIKAQPQQLQTEESLKDTPTGLSEDDVSCLFQLQEAD